MQLWRAIVVGWIVCGWALGTWGQETNAPRWIIECPSGVHYDLETGLAVATNGVTVRYGDAMLTAERATVNRKTGQVVAEHGVRFEYQGRIWTGERLEYNVRTGKVVADDFRAGQPPVFAQGNVLVGEVPANIYVGVDGLVTTDDYAEPSYAVRAKTIILVPGEYVLARQATLYVGKVPVLYLPVFRWSLKGGKPRFEVVPGYRSLYGSYALATYRWLQSEHFDSALHLDGRLKRGIGLGPDFNWRLGRYGDGAAKFYYTQDAEPGFDLWNRPIDDNRYRAWIGHFAYPATNLAVRGLLRYQSDPFIVRDFFESEYRENNQPSSYFEANHQWADFTLDAFVEPRVNNFFETVERLPEIKLTGLRQPVGNTPVFYESETSLGYFRRRFASGDTNLPFAAMRTDTFHQFLWPHTLFGWLTLTPRVGGRLSYYSEANDRGARTGEELRGVFNTGMEVSWKASRVWPEARSRFFQIDGIRHIVQPSINYVFVPDPTVAPRRLPQFDYVVPSTRLQPIEYPDFNAIDAIDSQNVIRFGLRNKLQTKRHGQIDNLVHWALYMDWRLDPRPDQHTFSDFYSDLDFRPFDWLTVNSQLRYDLNERFLKEANHLLTLSPNDVWSLSFGHRYLNDEKLFGPDSDNNIFYSNIYLRLGENWGFRMSHHFEAEDGVLEEQQYAIYRDFRSWTGALTFRVRDDRVRPTDFTVAFTFSLKAFPRFGVGDDSNRPSMLLGY